MTTLSPSFRTALEPVLFSLADDELVIGHRHSEWTGWAPHIEEDIAFSSIAQDEIGHAALFYRLLSEVVDRSPDELALGRQPSEYRHAIVCERPNRDWAFTVARHFLYESADRLRLESLRACSYKPLAEVVEKILREERYHQLHADAWFRRLAGGPVEARKEFAAAIALVLPEAAGVFENLESESEAIETGIWPSPSEDLMQSWLSEATGTIDLAGLPLTVADTSDERMIPTSSGDLIEEPEGSKKKPSLLRVNGWSIPADSPAFGGRYGRHSEDFGALWDDLTKTYREEPSATW